jgi:hypothetical protein
MTIQAGRTAMHIALRQSLAIEVAAAQHGRCHVALA